MAKAVCTLTTLLGISLISPVLIMGMEEIDIERPSCCSPRKRTRYEDSDQPYSPSSPRLERLLLALAVGGIRLPRRDSSSASAGSPTSSCSTHTGNRWSNESLDMTDGLSPISSKRSPALRMSPLQPSRSPRRAVSATSLDRLPCRKGRSAQECLALCSNCHASPCGMLEDGCSWYCQRGYDRQVCLSFCDRRPDTPVNIVDGDDY